MIFCAFGNVPAQESFIRMARAVDNLARDIDEEILAQVGNIRYDFKYLNAVKFFSHDEMLANTKAASLVILHGGWGSISEAIQLGKKIVAFPRIKGLEHRHDQGELVRALEKKSCLLGVYNEKDLPMVVKKARSFEFQPLKRGSAKKIIEEYVINYFGSI